MCDKRSGTLWSILLLCYGFMALLDIAYLYMYVRETNELLNYP